jgi:hypothetical protein
VCAWARELPARQHPNEQHWFSNFFRPIIDESSSHTLFAQGKKGYPPQVKDVFMDMAYTWNQTLNPSCC